jgi:hypothetical protein
MCPGGRRSRHAPPSPAATNRLTHDPKSTISARWTQTKEEKKETFALGHTNVPFLPAQERESAGAQQADQTEKNPLT